MVLIALIHSRKPLRSYLNALRSLFLWNIAGQIVPPNDPLDDRIEHVSKWLCSFFLKIFPGFSKRVSEILQILHEFVIP
jgi:hypothetical protein